MSIDWDLAVYSSPWRAPGSSCGAARKLGVDHATVSRRVNTLEAQIGRGSSDRAAHEWLHVDAGR